MKTVFFTLSFLLNLLSANSQTSKAITLADCYALAKQNYPLIKQRELILKSKEYSLNNLSKGYLPQLSINGQATYQSDVTSIPISLPGVVVPSLPKDQYKLYGEINQPLTDLVTIKHQKELQKINYAVQEENLEAELYKLQERINQLFFGTLLIDEQVKQNELLKKDIQTGLTKINAAIKNGIELKSNENKLKAELLKANQREIELRSARKAYTDMLGLFMNQSIDENTVFEKPISPVQASSINRPELKVYETRNKSYEVQKKLINSKNLPKFALFIQGGVGKPSPVNLFSQDLSTYYIGGLRLNWALSNLYTYKKEKLQIDIDQKIMETQKETFLFNTNFSLKQQSAEVIKLQELLKSDSEIIELRSSVKTIANAQLENGIITTNDFIKEVNAEDQARQTKLLHEIQLLIAQYTYQNTAGN